MVKKFLLSDEVGITKEDFNERKFLVSEFSKMPEEFFAKIRHFQPQVGCLNACAFCSKYAGNRIEYWDVRRIRNIVAALKYSSPQVEVGISKITYDRNEHRNNVIFPYLDNDIGNYSYLDEFIKLCFTELGVKTRVSTVGYSRYNEELNNMHKRINLLDKEGLAGVRLSFTPYEKGWKEESGQYSKVDYILDMANFLKIYKPYYDAAGTGERRMCVEIRYKPLVVNDVVYVTEVLNHKVIYCKNYLWFSKDTNITFKEAHIADPFDHNIQLTEEPIIFHSVNLYHPIESLSELKRIAHKFIANPVEETNFVEVYLFKNYDGEYYSINPRIEESGNYGINIYPKTERRFSSGYVITERFLLNEMYKYKHAKGLGSLEKFDEAKWDDVYSVLNMLDSTANKYKDIGKFDKSDYILNEVKPLISAYITVLQLAGFEASNFFDPDFTIDTGIICNLGRAINEFKGLTNKENEPLTPTHERNYGLFNSKMKQEGVSWRISCDYNNAIVIEKLNMFDTASTKGQVDFRKSIKLESSENEFSTSSDLNFQYLIPGQRRI